jgi:hypothetical protein
VNGAQRERLQKSRLAFRAVRELQAILRSALFLPGSGVALVLHQKSIVLANSMPTRTQTNDFASISAVPGKMGAAAATVAGSNPFHDVFSRYQLVVLNGLGGLVYFVAVACWRKWNKPDHLRSKLFQLSRDFFRDLRLSCGTKSWNINR